MSSDARASTKTASRQRTSCRRGDTGLTYDALKTLALALPEVAESTSYGTPALKLRGKLMIRLKEDEETVVVRTTWEERERLMVLHPEVFFVTDHYRAYPWVLMRLSTAPVDDVVNVLEHAWRCVAPRALANRYQAGLDAAKPQR